MFELLIAFILSATAPGAGQIFNGNTTSGIAILLFFIFGRTVFLPLMVRLLSLKSKISFLRLIYAFNILYIIVMIISVINAVIVAINAPHTLTGAVISFLIAMISISIYKGLRNAFIITALSGREDAAAYILSKK